MKKRNYLEEVPEYIMLLFAGVLSYIINGIRMIDKNLRKNGIAFLILMMITALAAVTAAYLLTILFSYIGDFFRYQMEMNQAEIAYVKEFGHF